MQPQGSSVIDTAYFTNLTGQIHATNSCSELQALVAQAFASIQAGQSAIQAELASLAPILALLEPPSANPGAIVSWITNLISGVLTPMTKPSITYAAQLAAQAGQIASVLSAIEAAASRIGSCTVTPPTLT